jgi:hypothetical protein
LKGGAVSLTGNHWLDLVLQGVLWGLAAFVGAYLAQKAKGLATREDIKTFQEQAEAKKRGETAAVQKDLDLILKQLEATKTLTSRIESDISLHNWDYQMRWGLKKDLYIRLLESLGQKLQVLSMIAALGEIITQPSDFITNVVTGGHLYDSEKNKVRALSALDADYTREIQRVAAVASISLDDEAVTVLDWMSAQIGAIDNVNSKDKLLSIKQQTEVLQQGFFHIAAIAKRDIGLTSKSSQ